MDETIFVVEMITSADPENDFDKLTKQGKDGANSIGQSRRAEYGKQKKLLSKSPRAGEILSLSTIDPVMAESALEFMRGLYPVRDFILKQKYPYLTQTSPLHNIAYGEMLKDMKREGGTHNFADPVLEVPVHLDRFMYTDSCPKLYDYLDVECAQYDNLMSAIEANYMDEEHRDIYQTRMFMPIAEVLGFVITFKQYGKGWEDRLKYLILNVHEMNIANLLKFLGYWDEYGYEKDVKFSSSVRLELISRKERFW